ncbi:MAG TPA: penicillin-binding protein 2 [Candidatus Babeliales bacterium]|nr:penicillin-binding protein 2 [Candidatus Babeliales bacterium]
MIQNFKARSTVIFFLFILAYLLISINLYVIQIKHHDYYKKLAKQQYHVTITQTPPRGVIYDRTGRNYLAMNKDYLAAFILPTQLTNKQKTLHFLDTHFPCAMKRFEHNKNKSFMFIKRRLSLQEIEIITTENNPDIFLLSEAGRYYPLPSASPMIGLTNVDNKGLLGIELLYDSMLAGKPTTCHLEKDARSGYFYFKKETTVQGNDSNPLQLTIDADLQFLAQEAVEATVEKFNAKEAAVLIMNPKNGEIIVMLSYPYFNPNNSPIANMENFKNKIITDAHELGSVMKVCAALAALEEGVITPDELIDCKSSLTTQIEGRTINTVKAHGIIPFTDVIALSNNIGIASVAKRLGTKLYDHYQRLGFGSKTGIKFSGENSGFLNPPEKWSKQSIISLSYGYEVSATILQLACAFCIIATGYKITPTLLCSNFLLGKKLYSDTTLAAVKNILEKTTLYGTAQKAAIKGYRIMSKTGTANMLIDGKYSTEKNIYSCAGIIEKDDYQRVIVTFVKDSQQKDIYASTVAVPLFESVAERMLIHDEVIS